MAYDTIKVQKQIVTQKWENLYKTLIPTFDFFG